MRLPLNYWLETIADDTIREAAINEYSMDKIQAESLSSAVLNFNKWGDLWAKYGIDLGEAYAMSLNSNLKQRPYTSPEGHTFNPDTGEWTMPAADHLPIREDKTAEIKITATHKSTGETKVFDLSSILCSIGSQWIGEELAWLPKNYDELIITVKQ